jgi:Surfeit locus protein 6
LPSKKSENGAPTIVEPKLEAQKHHEILVNKREAQKKHKSSNNKVGKKERKKAKQEKVQKLKMAKLALNAKQIETIKTEDSKADIKPAGGFNQASSLLFSKIEFPGKKKNSKIEPKRQLEMIKSEERKMKKLKEAGEQDKVEKLKADIAWKKALEKTQGKKPKDDVELLKKTIKKREHQKKKSIDKWKQRKEKVEHDQASRQKKRTENIAKKMKTKKVKKMKALTKRGRVIPGY